MPSLDELQGKIEGFIVKMLKL